MMAMLCLYMLTQSRGDGPIARLGTERKSFDKAVVYSRAHDLEENIYSMGPGSQHIYGFYPLGKADRRYLLATSNGGHAYAFLYQAIRRGKPRTIWALSLRDSAKRGPVKGTLASMLRAMYHAETVGKVTKEERRALASSQVFAGYGYDGIMRLYVWIVQTDGTSKPTYLVSSYPDNAPYFPILADESKSLGLGDRPWPTDLRYEPIDHFG